MDRRNLLRLMALSPLSAIAAACGGGKLTAAETQESGVAIRPLNEATAEAKAPEEPPFIIAAGEDRRLLMQGTPYETPLYVLGSGRPGKIALALGGVHGNEPGGWLAAERVLDRVRPDNGAILIVPRANKVAISLGERTTDDLADLNRSYPGFEDGKPMERLASEIVAAIREFQADIVHDMHESWAFYKDRTTNGTAFLGQTIATNGDAGTALVQAVIQSVNSMIQHEREEFFTRDFGRMQQPNNLPRQTDIPPPGRGTSSLGLNRAFPELIPVLVEMGQQQTLERRIALHVQVFEAVLTQVGIKA